MNERLISWQKQINLFTDSDPHYLAYRNAVNAGVTPDTIKTPVIALSGKWSAAKPIVSVQTYSVRGFAGVKSAWKRQIHDWYMKFFEEKYFISDINCDSCGLDGHLQICSGCYQVAYCSRSCQMKKWENHKIKCLYK